MNQGSLFGPPNQYGDVAAPSVPNSPTSEAAAEAIKPHASELRERVYAHIASCGERGCTDEEGIDATGIGASTYRPRRCELIEAGRVRDSGTTRKTRSGRTAVVWRVTGDVMAELHSIFG